MHSGSPSVSVVRRFELARTSAQLNSDLMYVKQFTNRKLSNAHERKLVAKQ